MKFLRAHSDQIRRFGPVALVVVLVLGLTIFAITRGGKSDIVVRAAETATAEASSTPGSDGSPTPQATGQPGQTITKVKDLVSKFGYPPGTDFAEIRIPTIGVDAKVGARTVGRDAIMAAPAGPADVVWYDLSLWKGLGGTPGEGHNAVFSGHADYADPVLYAKVSYRGQGVFSQLRLLSQGDVIEVIYKGQTLRYSVAWRQQLTSGSKTDWGTIWSANTGSDSITLYTCGGAFDSTTREYQDRIIVRANRI